MASGFFISSATALVAGSADCSAEVKSCFHISFGARCGCWAAISSEEAYSHHQGRTYAVIDTAKPIPAICIHVNDTSTSLMSRRLTEVVRHEHLIGERMFRPYSHQRLILAQSIEAETPALTSPPLDLLLDVIEERDDIAEAVLNTHVAVCHGDEQDLELFGECGSSEEQGKDVIDALQELS